MSAVDLHIRYSRDNVVLDKIATLSIEGNLVYRDEIDNFRAHATSMAKFSVITATSPLFALLRLVRAAAFAISGDFNRAKREFIGGLSVPIVAATCLLGSLASSAVYLLDLETVSLHVQMKRIYAYFEAWVNDIDLLGSNLASFSHRISNPLDFIGAKNGIHDHVWTTAPCVQPVLERGYSKHGGIFDLNRMKKIFPHIEINGIRNENGKIVLQSKYENRNFSMQFCNGVCEHARSAVTYCCWRVETAYDRVLCFEVGQGNCTSIADHNDTCGFVFCNAGCGVGICCCTEQNNLVQVNTCLITN